MNNHSLKGRMIIYDGRCGAREACQGRHLERAVAASDRRLVAPGRPAVTLARVSAYGDVGHTA